MFFMLKIILLFKLNEFLLFVLIWKHLSRLMTALRSISCAWNDIKTIRADLASTIIFPLYRNLQSWKISSLKLLHFYQFFNISMFLKNHTNIISLPIVPSSYKKWCYFYIINLNNIKKKKASSAKQHADEDVYFSSVLICTLIINTCFFFFFNPAVHNLRSCCCMADQKKLPLISCISCHIYSSKTSNEKGCIPPLPPPPQDALHV